MKTWTEKHGDGSTTEWNIDESENVTDPDGRILARYTVVWRVNRHTGQIIKQTVPTEWLTKSQ